MRARLVNNSQPWQTDREYNRYIIWFIYCCVIYSIIGFSWGVVVGSYEDLRLFINKYHYGKNIMLAHAHLNLLGWVEMAIFAAIYYIVPRVVQRSIYSLKLVKVHFWIHNIGLLGMVMFFTMAGVIGGVAAGDGVDPDTIKNMVKPWMITMGLFGTLVLLANLIWAYNLFRTCNSWVRK